MHAKKVMPRRPGQHAEIHRGEIILLAKLLSQVVMRPITPSCVRPRDAGYRRFDEFRPLAARVEQPESPTGWRNAKN
jgi:hypothetical protein